MAPNFSKLESEVRLLLKANCSINTIISTLNRPKRCIQNTIQRIKRKEKDLKTINNKDNRGRISKLNSRDKRAINRDLTRSPKKENKRLLLENSLSISKRTLQRFIKEEDYSINIASKKALLDRFKAKTRYNLVKELIKNKRNINLNRVIFSDEAAIERGHGSQ